MAASNPQWGAKRIRGALLKLGIRVVERTVAAAQRVVADELDAGPRSYGDNERQERTDEGDRDLRARVVRAAGAASDHREPGGRAQGTRCDRWSRAVAARRLRRRRLSGTTLVRPALERLRDRVAEGAVDRLYVHSPDRLARKYAYQVLLLEELRKHGVAVVFLNAPSGKTAEGELLVQRQGMIAEYAT